MRMVILVAAFGLLGATVALSPVLSSAAQAQSASEQQAAQAQLIALAQAGDWAAFEAIVNVQVGAGRAGMLAAIAENISEMGLTLADSDDNSATALSLAAIALVDNGAVAASNTNLAATVGGNAGRVKAKIQRRNPGGAAALASAVARNSASGLMAAYNSGELGTQQTGGTTPVRAVVRRTPPRPDAIEPPEIPEPNPSQSGSPT